MTGSKFDDNEPDDRNVDVRTKWVVVAETVNRTLAEFAVNGLKSYDIPAALDARAGFLGSVGLKLRSIKDGQLQTFKILSPAEFAEEAAEIVKIFLGDSDDPGKDREYTEDD
ncbi:MAG: hypothetical protein GY841_21920 [FCB group bacterium]|nr:hypothetical protein [FCB group bacterium]